MTDEKKDVTPAPAGPIPAPAVVPAVPAPPATATPAAPSPAGSDASAPK
jgi:hypothetical protein